MLKSRWQELDGKFAALSQRERILLASAVLAMIFYLGVVLWLWPMLARIRNYDTQVAQQAVALTGLDQQLTELQQQVALDPDAKVKSDLVAVRQALAASDDKLAEFRNTLVAPAEMGAMLDGILGHARNVHLLSLRTLPVESVVAASGDKGLYKHGFELRLEGDYLGLLAYLSELEKQPKQLLWQQATLSAEHAPRVQLELRVYTLSFDRDWLQL
jgi:MSHA biogenesis protein MshJ